MALVGNKCDLPHDKIAVSATHSLELASKYKMIWAEVSAKTGEGV
jgi:hypothetical protein